jgi:hypothetical protein
MCAGPQACLNAATEDVRAGNYHVNLVRACLDRAPNFSHALNKRRKAGRETRRDRRHVDVRTLKRAQGHLHKRVVHTNRGHGQSETFNSKLGD